tara:strand:+ start:211 stop:426 length:216 start_codon:yes stop_codon:yes gene_type:complete
MITPIWYKITVWQTRFSNWQNISPGVRICKRPTFYTKDKRHGYPNGLISANKMQKPANLQVFIAQITRGVI